MAIDIEEVPVRSGSAADWAAATTVLAEGEVGLVTDTGEYRVGDGTNVFGSLTSRSGPFKRGRATLAAGTVTVTGLAGVVAADHVFVTVHTLGTVAAPKVVRAVAGTNQIVLTSEDVTDTSIVQYVVFKA